MGLAEAFLAKRRAKLGHSTSQNENMLLDQDLAIARDTSVGKMMPPASGTSRKAVVEKVQKTP